MRAVSRAGYGISAPCHTLKAAQNRPFRARSRHGFYLAFLFGSLIFNGVGSGRPTTIETRFNIVPRKSSPRESVQNRRTRGQGLLEVTSD